MPANPIKRLTPKPVRKIGALVKSDIKAVILQPGEKKPKSKETKRMELGKLKIEEQFLDRMITDFEPQVTWGANGLWNKIVFRLPMPPSVNQWTRVWRGKAHASPVAKVYIERANQLLFSAGIKPTMSMMNILIQLYGIPPQSDVDGRFKQVKDCLQGVICHNDYQFRDDHIIDMETHPKQGSYIIVTVTHRT